MKKLILFTTLIFALSLSFGQSLQKGNLVGTHVAEVSLKPGVTMEQFTELFINKYIPEAEKIWKGWKFYLVKGIRGENINSFGLIIIVNSQKDRDKYYNSDGTSNELGNTAFEKLKTVQSELDKLGTWTSKYTDWVIQ
jgi:hypothetical protein